SMATPLALPHVLLILSDASSAASWSRSPIATCAPYFAYVTAIALPMPLAAPVTMATLPSRFFMICAPGDVESARPDHCQRVRRLLDYMGAIIVPFNAADKYRRTRLQTQAL